MQNAISTTNLNSTHTLFQEEVDQLYLFRDVAIQDPTILKMLQCVQATPLFSEEVTQVMKFVGECITDPAMLGTLVISSADNVNS